MHRDVIIYAWETVKRSTKLVFSTSFSTSNTATAHLFCHIARYDFANAIAYCQYSEQLASHARECMSIRACIHCFFLKKNTVH